MNRQTLLFVLSALSASTLAPAQAPPAGFEKVDSTIEIGMQVGRLRFNKERFAVAPGAKVKLVLKNNDAMQHNLIICKPGKDTATRVGNAALKLGPAAMDKQFVPDSPDVLYHTKAILPGQNDTIWFRAPKTPGEYPYICTLPGHMFTMRGVMVVGKDVKGGASAPLTPLRNASYRVYHGAWKKLPDFRKLSPDQIGTCKGGKFDIYQFGRTRDLAVQFTGHVHVEAAGEYTFRLNSDDGSRLFVHGKQLLDYDGLHGMAKERVGKVALKKGANEVRIDFFQHRGGIGLIASCEGADMPRFELTAARRAKPVAGIPIHVMDDPVVMRVHLEHTGGRNIAVGLPGGMNCCFDAEAGYVRYGWAGAFLDVGPDRLGRGGKPCKILGQRFEVGDAGFPLRTASGEKGEVKFRGYRLGKWPEFLLTWNGKPVSMKVLPSDHGVGLRYAIKIQGADGDVQFVVKPHGLKLKSTVGTFDKGTLRVPRAAAKDFTVSITRGHGH